MKSIKDISDKSRFPLPYKHWLALIEQGILPVAMASQKAAETMAASEKQLSSFQNDPA
jgi:hypothetical protein